jgi:hypothetical protein
MRYQNQIIALTLVDPKDASVGRIESCKLSIVTIGRGILIVCVILDVEPIGNRHYGTGPWQGYLLSFYHLVLLSVYN